MSRKASKESEHTDPNIVCFSPFSRDGLSLLYVCSLFFRSNVIKSQFAIIALLRPSTTKASTQNLQTIQVNWIMYRCGELILRLLVAFGLWVFVMRHFSALFSMCHWFFVMLYLAGDHVVPSGRSPLYVTKSSDEGQIMLPSGRSPLYETKSSNEGQIMLA